jgi:4-amino-4-deoxy-L-arabinose transferase-like glycosyltransferase
LAVLAFGAILLRLSLFLGRGDFVAFDEGWYLLLGQSLWSGDGYRLTGLRHTTLSPLFPILAGGLGRVIGDPVWAGRIVAAVTSGLLVIPCWSIFRRLAGRRTALFACVIVALTPSLAPFLAPELVGWDLWVGAEPVYHLFLYSGIALALRAVADQRWRDWFYAGTCFALAFLARPEAVVPMGLFGLLAIGSYLIRRRPRQVLGPLFGALAIVLIASPYLMYLRDATGNWTLTGRAVQVQPVRGDRPRASTVIERMLWEGRHGAYVRVLFALDSSSTRMASGYWGVPEADTMQTDRAVPLEAAESIGSTGRESETELAAVQPNDSESASVTSRAAATSVAEPSRAALYAGALERIVPVVLVPFMLIGLLAPRRKLRSAELFFVVPLLATSFLIARIVAIDPRTQLFLVPALIFYAARGARYLGVVFDARVAPGRVRTGLVPALCVLIIVAVLGGESIHRLYLSLRVETTYKFLAAENRRAGKALRRIVPEGEAIMSWHPAVALHARRDWRVLPLAPLTKVVRYATAIGAEYIVFSVFNPSPMPPDKMWAPYQLLHLPPASALAEKGTIELLDMRNGVAVSRLVAE